MTPPIEEIARGLTEAQRRVILSLPSDGEFGRAADSRCARRMFYGVGKSRAHVVEHQHCTDNSWRLSDLGIALRTHLQSRQP